jgi:phosphatidylinositol 3-kinase
MSYIWGHLTSTASPPSQSQEKFRLDLNDQGAVEWMQQLINESVTALMPQIVETGHRIAQYWR